MLPTEIPESLHFFRDKAHHRGDQRISRRFVGAHALATETRVTEVLCQPAPEVGEGVFGSLGSRITARRRLLQLRAVDLRNGRRDHAEIQMICHGIGVARLRLGEVDPRSRTIFPKFNSTLSD